VQQQHHFSSQLPQQHQLQQQQQQQEQQQSGQQPQPHQRSMAALKLYTGNWILPVRFLVGSNKPRCTLLIFLPARRLISTQLLTTNTA
jgi:hypothetical protein